MTLHRLDTSKGDTTRVEPIALDIDRAIMRLDAVADIGKGDDAMIHGERWSYRKLIDSIAGNIAFVFNLHGVSTRKFSMRDARVALAAGGASTFTIDRHARAVAAAVRAATMAHGRMSAR